MLPIFKRDLESIGANLPRYWSNISLAFSGKKQGNKLFLLE